MLNRAAILRPAIGQDAQERDALFFKERQHTVVERVSRYQRVLPVVEFGESDARVGVDEGLLVDAPDSFEGADIVGVLRAEIARMLGLDLTVFFLLPFRSFQ